LITWPRDAALSVTVTVADAAEASQIKQKLARHNLRPICVMRSTVALERKPKITGKTVKYLFCNRTEASLAHRLLAKQSQGSSTRTGSTPPLLPLFFERPGPHAVIVRPHHAAALRPRVQRLAPFPADFGRL
jgi:hypothetical protein